MAYLSLYRKYRSQTFADLMGQDHVIRIIRNGITSGRIAHAYLFTGPRGTGKTSTARLLAKALSCEKGPTTEPCNECHICVSITEGSFMDVYEMDAASESGVDDVREAIVNVTEYLPTIGRYKIFIIDEVHDLSPKAFDALLKTIEEPPAHIIFVLATTEYNKVPPTIRSRCQKFEFHRATLQDLTKRLEHVASQENVKVEPAALSAIARMADGGFRDALTLLEQAMLTSDGDITMQQVYDQLGLIPEEVADDLLLSIKEGNVPKLIELLAEITRLGRDPRSILESLLYRIADLTRAAYGLEAGGDGPREAVLHDAATKLGRDHLLRLRGAIAEAHKVIRDISLPRLWLEAELVRLAAEKPVSPLTNGAAKQAPAKEPVEARQPAPEKAAPAPTKTPEKAEPVPAVVVAPNVVSPPPPAAESADDPELARARTAWTAAVAELSGISKTMAMKLGSTVVAAVKGENVSVEFDRNFDCEWIQEQPKRTQAVIEAMKKHYGPEVKLHLRVARKIASAPQEPAAVELPAEGQKLAEMAREILGG